MKMIVAESFKSFFKCQINEGSPNLKTSMKGIIILIFAERQDNHFHKLFYQGTCLAISDSHEAR